MAAGQRHGWLPYVNAPSSLESLRWHWDHVFSYDPLPVLQRLQVPMLVLYGELDAIVPPRIHRVRMEQAMRAAGTARIVFSSTGSVYGEPEVFPTPEDCPFPVQTSLYAASKLAGEGLIAAYCTGYAITGVVYRFVSILGERYTHGHVYDFVAALRRDPSELHVLGDGRQEKSYLYVGDCVEAILTGLAAARGGSFSVFNLGTDETLVVDDSVAAICAALGVAPQIEHSGGRRGWVGDSPLIRLDTTRIRELGWTPQLTIPEAVARTVAWLEANPFVFGERAVA